VWRVSRRLAATRSKKLYPYLWFLPMFGLLGTVLVYPWIWSLYLSFHTWNVALQDSPSFTGVMNYEAILADRLFWSSLKNSLVLIVISVPLQFVFGLGYALLLDTGVRARQVFLTAVMLPFVLAPVMVALIWKILLQDEFGVVNYYLRVVGIGGVPWLSSPSLTMATIIILEIWQYTPFVVLILYAGLQAIPGEIREAAKVDGASATQLLFFITLPCLKNLILIVLLFRTIFAVRTFDVIYGLFGAGGPANAGMVVGVYLFEELTVNWELGKASAISYVVLLLTMLLSVSLTYRIFRVEEE
jgi:multiple sugar transport system permease protein